MRWIGLSVLACLVMLPPSGTAAQRQSRRGSNLSLRKRLHVNTLIAEPGTGEVDWSGLYSFTSGFTMPSGLRFTPAGTHILWGRTEYDVFTDFNQSATLAATTVLYDGDKFDFAFQPQATFFVRNESGERFGATAIARYDTGKSSIGGTASWSYGTHPSSTNPAGILDLGVGFGRRLAAEGFLGRFTPHANSVWERTTGQSWSLSFFEGVEFQATDRLGIDVSGQHLSVRGDAPEHQIAFGVTYSLGKLH